MRLVFLTPIVLLLSAYSDNHTYSENPSETNNPENWKNPKVFKVNKEDARAYFIPYRTVEQIKKDNATSSPFYKSLNGVWKFNLAHNPSERPFYFYKKDDDISDWKEIKVPRNCELQGYDAPIGPHENYWDRKTGAKISVYNGPVKNLNWNYIRSQENGNKSDVRWIHLTNDEGAGLKIYGFPTIDFSIYQSIMEDFESAERTDGRHIAGNVVKNRHTSDVKMRDLTSLNIDFKQMGVGGDNS